MTFAFNDSSVIRLDDGVIKDMKKTVLCYGDSNTFGYNPVNGLRYPLDVLWTGRLGRMLVNDWQVIEEGCNGRTTIYDDPDDGWKNGLDYLRPCLNSHKPIDVVILMLGSNDLKQTFRLSVEEIAAGVQTLVKVILSFTLERQGFQPKIILVSPPEIGPNMIHSPFGYAFSADACAKSKQFSIYYQQVAKQTGCIFFDAAQYVRPSDIDSLHLMPDAHAVLAEQLLQCLYNSL